MSITQSCVLYLFSLQNSKLFILFPHFGRYHGSTLISASLSGYDNFIFNISNQKMYSNYINFKLFSSLTRKLLPRLPALHQKFDLPAPFVLHTDCPHYWRYHLPGCHFISYSEITFWLLLFLKKKKNNGCALPCFRWVRRGVLNQISQ